MERANFTSFRSEVNRLVEAFERDKELIRLNGMNETTLRGQFLDPFFSALGWDVGNRELKPFALREVLVEPASTVQGVSRRPDYLFRVGGIDKFICEAKKPFDHIDRHFFQTQNYVYNLRLWFGVLSDFEHFIVFLVGAQPSSDRPFPPLEGWRISYWQYSDLSTKLWDHFSYDAVADGALDRLAHTAAKSYRAGKQGWLIKPDRTQRIDGKFLSFLEDQRSRLAEGLKLANNHSWTTQTLTEATQKIIDRLLFQRICEDRHIDVGTSLNGTLEAWESRKSVKGQLWPSIVSNFKFFKGAFNGGLFGKKDDPPHLVDGLSVPDDWLADFLDTLTADDSPYLFSVIPVEILGSVYERFLGSVVLPSGKVEPKPEVRKAGGVYYTPRHVVDFIVTKTLSPLLADKTPEQVFKLRVLDPACGSGSFLLDAFERLCEYHVSWLLKHPADQSPDKCYKTKGPDLLSSGDLRLTTGFKRKILKSNIFGVDIDPQAVEVTQMSLYLKVLEGETHESLENDHLLFPKETYLPDLDANIKCGNSLVGPDALDDFSGSASELVALKPFDWGKEFKSILKDGGFDIVIGNPPYLNVDDSWGKKDYRLHYLKTRYTDVYTDKTDILFYFFHRAVSLSKNKVAFIVSRAFLEAFKAEKLRGWLADQSKHIEIVDFQNQLVFENVGITTCITLLSKVGKKDDMIFYRALTSEHLERPLDPVIHDKARFARIVVPFNKVGKESWLFGEESDEALLQKIDGANPKLGDILTLGQGMQTGLNKVFGSLPPSVIKDWKLPKTMWRWRARNSDIKKWVIEPSDEVLLYLEDVPTFSKLPDAIKSYLKKHKSELQERAAFVRGDCEWWKYTWPLHKELYGKQRILCPFLASTNRFALEHSGRSIGLTDTTVIFDGDQPEDIRYFIALLNSQVLTWRFTFIGKLKSNGIREYFWNSISKMPIPRPDLSQAPNKRRHDQIVEWVRKIVELSEQRNTASAQEIIAINRAIDTLEEQLESAVADVFDLTPEERKHIQAALQRNSISVGVT